VASVSEVPHVLNPEELLLCEDGLLRPYIGTQSMDTRRLRGKQTSVYVQNGLVYAFRMNSLLEHHSLYGQKTIPLFTPWEDFVDIDTMEDLQLANSRVELYAAGSTRERIWREQLK
jgi:CMP-N-acetylneuraminic acid synthetase